MNYKNDHKQLIPFDDSKHARSMWLQNLFVKYENYYRNEIDRMIRNQNMYWGVNYGQWPSWVVEKLKEQGRVPPTYNIIAKKIESNIGNYLANGFDLKFSTVSGHKSDWAMHLKTMALSDKRNCDWQTSENVCLRDNHCMVGYERMRISDRLDPVFGNIAFEVLPPTHIYISPSWKSQHAFDIRDYFEWGFFTVGELIELYPHIESELKEWRDRELLTGVDFGNYAGGVQRWSTVEQKWGSAHRVITFHSTRKYEREWEYDLLNHCPFPENGFKVGSDEDRQEKQKYIEQNGIQDKYVTVKQKKTDKYIEMIVPSINNELFIVKGKDRIQTNNCNIYPLGNQFYGQYRGFVDDLYSTQDDVNVGNMRIMDIQARSAVDARFLDKALVHGDEELMHEIEAMVNRPGANIWVDEGVMNELGANGGIVPIKPSSPTPDMFALPDKRLSLADYLTTPAASEARNDVTNPSGKLFQSQVAVAQVGQKYPLAILERHKREKMQAYAIQARITYSGYPRTFTETIGGEPIEINIPGEDPMGNRVWINNIDKMPDMTVTVTPAQNGFDLKEDRRTNYGQALQYLTDPADRLLKLIAMERVFDTIEGTDEEKEEFQRAITMLKTNAAMLLTAEHYKVMAELGNVGIVPQQGEIQGVNATPLERPVDQGRAIEGTLQDEREQMIDRRTEEMVVNQ